ncbi:DNA-binding transcriptional regulator, AcrR family [Nocardiopsis flavescens]|uniref:DNA-binding transcriptional regulator, AcrR family n=1 Tax=Nocardiopsis flavescens TaxID=758803 RepID=A0A1M6MRS6_9ACTN|nr:TetR/AcrR family transcriptional regulator [Nocardiopsis flavescens]SHJ86154.1 DNA-binding transcriptional regulator, AcrR family [Nocardiopsis flavescens]
MAAAVDDGRARREIVEAADGLFYAHGVNAVGMDAVRERAGFPLKRIYKLFPSKEDLVIAVLEHRSRMWNEGITRAERGSADPVARLLAVFDFLAAWFREDGFRGCAFINAYGELGPGSTRVARAVREQKASFRVHVADLVGRIGGSPALAAQLVLLAEGAQTTAAIAGSPEAADVARGAALTLIEADTGASRTA